MANSLVGPVLPLAGNQVQMTSNGKVQVTNSQGKVKTLSQSQFKKQLVKNMDKISNGEDVEFKEGNKNAKTAAIAGAAIVGTLAALGLAVQKRVLKPVRINKEDVLLQKGAKKIQNFAYAIGKKVSIYSNKAIHATVDFFNKHFPKSKEKLADAADKLADAAKKVSKKARKSAKKATVAAKKSTGKAPKVN